MLRRYYIQNTFEADFWEVAMLFFNRLKDRVWERGVLTPIFVKAYQKNIPPNAKPLCTEISMCPPIKRLQSYTLSTIKVTSKETKYVRKIWDET